MSYWRPGKQFNFLKIFVLSNWYFVFFILMCLGSIYLIVFHLLLYLWSADMWQCSKWPYLLLFVNKLQFLYFIRVSGKLRAVLAVKFSITILFKADSALPHSASQILWHIIVMRNALFTTAVFWLMSVDPRLHFLFQIL